MFPLLNWSFKPDAENIMYVAFIIEDISSVSIENLGVVTLTKGDDGI